MRTAGESVHEGSEEFRVGFLGNQRIGEKRSSTDREAMLRNQAAMELVEQLLLFKNEFPEKEDVSLCKTGFLLRYN